MATTKIEDALRVGGHALGPDGLAPRVFQQGQLHLLCVQPPQKYLEQHKHVEARAKDHIRIPQDYRQGARRLLQICLRQLV